MSESQENHHVTEKVRTFGTLYQFLRADGRLVLVVRLTNQYPLDDWLSWPDIYIERYPDIGVLQDIAGIEVEDERGTSEGG